MCLLFFVFFLNYNQTSRYEVIKRSWKVFFYLVVDLGSLGIAYDLKCFF